MMMLLGSSSALLALLHLVVVHAASASSYCAFLSNVEPVEYLLPVDLVEPDTKLKFVDIVPIITRKVSPRHKITITRYSVRPTIQVDEADGSLIISSDKCVASSEDTAAGGDGATTTTTASAARSTMRQGGGWSWGIMATAASTMMGLSHNHNSKPHPPFLVLAVVGLPLLFSSSNGGFWVNAAAEDDNSCSHTVEIVLEGPATYRGAVEVCEAEVKEIGHCPNPFPTFASCDPSPTLSCPVAVVGAGAGALYTALRYVCCCCCCFWGGKIRLDSSWLSFSSVDPFVLVPLVYLYAYTHRLVDTKTISASDICVFETTERVGGRLFSLRGLGPDADLTVDAGGYRTVRTYYSVVYCCHD
jgi:hypothetical protein